MSAVKITLELPSELVERAKAIGLELETNEQIIATIEQQIRRKEAFSQLRAISEQLAALPDDIKPSLEEIAAEIRAVRQGDEAVAKT